MERLLSYINTITPLSSGLIEHLKLILKEKKFSRKDYLLKTGQVCKQIYFMQKGMVRCFYNKNLAEVSTWFMKEGDLIISVDSFYKQKPGFESIQALEETSVLGINYDELQYMYRVFGNEFVGRVLTEKYYALSEQRLYSLRMQRSSERYLYLRDNFPELIQRVPSKYIASYIGVTEETLSRIRSRKY